MLRECRLKVTELEERVKLGVWRRGVKLGVWQNLVSFGNMVLETEIGEKIGRVLGRDMSFSVSVGVEMGPKSVGSSWTPLLFPGLSLWEWMVRDIPVQVL
ncbi:hypothetical protein M758_11G153600 [Ceratodon purpureus]|nr:hypothetical protein M758_11G153600 [Ceratodon purpureus]